MIALYNHGGAAGTGIVVVARISTEFGASHGIMEEVWLHRQI
jgi:hypothetical protein